jgi:hypothetical protein
MTVFYRKIFMTLIGLIAGMASWGAIEILLSYSYLISRHLVWNSLAGAAMGLIFGFFFGSAEGIMFSDIKRSIRGGLTGAVLGLAGGIGAVILAQGLLYWIGNAELLASSFTDSFLTPISRALGWGLLGMIIGSVDGIRSGSAKRIGIGLSGGLLGGLIGGLLLEFLTGMWSNSYLVRGIGMVVLGTGIGLFFTVFEYSRAYGRIRILTGALRGKEYLLVMRKTKIGSSPGANISLGDYTGVVKNHAVLTANRDGVIIKDNKGAVLVNDQPVVTNELKYEDVIQIGDAKLFYLPK